MNPTHKNVVWRNVRKAATHTWRDNVKQLAYEVLPIQSPPPSLIIDLLPSKSQITQVRKNMTETPYATEKKERHAIAERKVRHGS